MGKYVVKQPNGLYCYYADSTHEVWAYNMTFEELVDYNAKIWNREIEEAKTNILWTLENPVYTFKEFLEDWVWHNEEIHKAMEADPATVEPCYIPQNSHI